jgi:hypothetical protein
LHWLFFSNLDSLLHFSTLKVSIVELNDPYLFWLEIKPPWDQMSDAAVTLKARQHHVKTIDPISGSVLSLGKLMIAMADMKCAHVEVKLFGIIWEKICACLDLNDSL